MTARIAGNLAACALLAGAAWLGGGTLARSATEGAYATVRVRPVQDPDAVHDPDQVAVPGDCAGGAKGRLSAELIATEARSEGGSERLVFEGEVRNERRGDAWVGYSVSITDLSGESVSPRQHGRPQVIPPNARSALQVRTPPRLDDGLYIVTVYASSSTNGDDSESVIVRKFFEVDSGGVAPLSAEDFAVHPAANEGVTVP